MGLLLRSMAHPGVVALPGTSGTAMTLAISGCLRAVGRVPWSVAEDNGGGSGDLAGVGCEYANERLF